MSADLDVVVIGAGAAGLAAAHELRARGREVLVLEANDRPGGVMQADTKEGFTFDRGPNTFRLTGPARALLETAGVLDTVVKASPESRARFLLGPDGLEAVPLGPLDLVTTRLISGKAKRRMLREPFVAKGDGGSESVAEFVARRLGDEAVEKLVAGPRRSGCEWRGAFLCFPAFYHPLSVGFRCRTSCGGGRQINVREIF